MLDRVFHQGLQRHRWQRQRQQHGRHVHLQRQPRAHADLEDFKVGLGALQLHAQGGHRLVHARQRASQVLDQVPEHLVGARRIGAGEHLRIGQRVVQEVRLHLGMQQVELGHRQFFLGGGLLGSGLLVAALLGHPPGDRTGHRFGVLVIAAFIHRQKVGPDARVRLEQQGDAAGALPRGDRGQHAVAADRPACRQVPARRRAAVVGVHAAHVGAHLQAAGGAFDVFHARQLGDGLLHQCKGRAGVHRQLDLAALAAGQRGAVQAPGDQPDPADVGDAAADGGDRQEHRQQPEDPAGAVVHATENATPDKAGHDDGGGPGQQDAKDQSEAGEHGGVFTVGWDGPSIALPRARTSGMRRRPGMGG
ncbi:hypothetical protein D3C71_1374700 [compost metagenome]